MDISTILSSGVVAGIVAGLVTLQNNERKIAIENITQQRQLWREKIRSIALKINDAYQTSNKETLNSQYIELQLLLNPDDPDDKSILDTVWEMIPKEKTQQLPIVLGEKLSLLLKHDWERAKQEAKPKWFCCKPVKRVSHENFKFKRVGS